MLTSQGVYVVCLPHSRGPRFSIAESRGMCLLTTRSGYGLVHGRIQIAYFLTRPLKKQVKMTGRSGLHLDGSERHISYFQSSFEEK